MPTSEEKVRFVSNVVAQSMSSGKFLGSDIQGLTDLAAQAFENTFGAMPESASAPASTGVPTPSLPPLTLPEGKDFKIWVDDRCLYGKKEWTAWGKPWPDVTWGELLTHAKAGEEKALNAIRLMADSDPGDPSAKWYELNRRKISRARALQAML